MNSVDYLVSKNELEQSEFFKYDYEKSFDLKPKSQIFSDFFTEYKDLAERLNEILVSCNDLTDFQKNVLQNFFIVFYELRKAIDPGRLKTFKHSFNDDDELVLYRNTESKLINIIINPEDCFALSVIPKSLDSTKSLDFYEEDYKDFEGLAYQFFS